MRIYVHCPVCLNEYFAQMQRTTKGDSAGMRPVVPYPSDVPDDGIVELTCRQNHETVILLYANRFGLLFDSGASALADGYPREAVASFAASVERFYEHITTALFAANGVQRAAIDKYWKTVKNQSERQLGAFRAAYLQDFKQVAPDLEKYTEFRNSVIHKGHFPTHDEAAKYGQVCLDHMRQILDEVQAKHPEAMQGVADWNGDDIQKRARRKDRMTHIRDSIVESFANHLQRRRSLAEWLDEARQANDARHRYQAWQIVRQLKVEATRHPSAPTPREG